MKVRQNLDKICEQEALWFGKYMKWDLKWENNFEKWKTEEDAIWKINMEKSAEHAK